MDYPGRIRRLQKAMVEANFPSLVYGTGGNFQYFTGLLVPWTRNAEPEQPTCLLLVRGDEARVLLDGEHADFAEQTHLPCDVAQSPAERVAWLKRYLEGTQVATSREASTYLGELIAKASPTSDCVSREELGEAMRMCKDADEIALLRRATAINDQVMAGLIEHIRPGITALQLGGLIAEMGQEFGAQGCSFPGTALFVKSGSEPSPEVFVYPRDEGLVPKTSVAFDFGYLLDGYCSDYGRSFYCGEAPDHITGAYRALQEAQCHLISQMKPGQMKINQMFGVLEAALDERGYGDRLRARLSDGTLGHQIGVDVHENPWIKPISDIVLQPGMVMAIEPKLWLPGEYYLRVEDIVLVTEDGAESMTTFDRELFSLPA